MGWQSVDLCPRCEKKLEEWLNNKEERTANKECKECPFAPWDYWRLEERKEE